MRGQAFLKYNKTIWFKIVGNIIFGRPNINHTIWITKVDYIKMQHLKALLNIFRTMLCNESRVTVDIL